jgi:hypothetical protein
MGRGRQARTFCSTKILPSVASGPQSERNRLGVAQLICRPRQAPTAPSMPSRSKSACPACWAYSAIIRNTSHRSV